MAKDQGVGTREWVYRLCKRLNTQKNSWLTAHLHKIHIEPRFSIRILIVIAKLLKRELLSLLSRACVCMCVLAMFALLFWYLSNRQEHRYFSFPQKRLAPHLFFFLFCHEINGFALALQIYLGGIFNETFPSVSKWNLILALTWSLLFINFEQTANSHRAISFAALSARA